MARVLKSFILSSIRGKLGDIVVRQHGNKVIVSKLGVITKKPSKKQKQQQSHFKDAIKFAKACMEDPKLKAKYEQLSKKKEYPNAYNAAVSEYFKKLKQ